MDFSVTIKVTGQQALQSKLHARYLTYQDGIFNAIQQAGENTAAYAIAIAPYDPKNTTKPHIRDNIKKTQTGQFSCNVSTGTDHDLYVEFGTVKMRAQPYFRPAIRRARAVLLDTLRSL
jgi:HK97 gp10 family phage protein